jgi:hypothetical protein
VVWIVVAAAAVLLLVVVIGAVVLLKRGARDLAAEQQKLEEAQKTTAHLETRVATLRHELADQHRTNAELTARLRTAGDARGAGLWVLERLRQSRLAGTPPLRAASGPGLDMAADLQEALVLELELLREEVGTHAEIGDIALGDQVSAREALAVLRIVQELAATVAKRADELRIDITRDSDAAVVTVVAIGWNDNTPHHGVLERGVSALQGALDLRAENGTLTAEVRIPDAAG